MSIRTESICEHQWRYFVHVATRAVRVKVCERCGKRGVVPSELAPLPVAARRPEKRSA